MTKEYLKNLYTKNSRIPAKYLQDTAFTVPAIDSKSYSNLANIKDKIDLFVKQHQNLLISSNTVGNGKTTWACKILLSYINNYACNYAYPNSMPVLFINVPEFLMKKKLAINDPKILEEVSELEKGIFEAKIVVFDDIATKTASEYDKELLYVYVNSRINNLLTSIYTTNVLEDDLEAELGERLTSRIIGESNVIKLLGPAMRGYNK